MHVGGRGEWEGRFARLRNGHYAANTFSLSPPPTPPPSDPILWDMGTSTEMEVDNWAHANRAVSDIMHGHLSRQPRTGGRHGGGHTSPSTSTITLVANTTTNTNTYNTSDTNTNTNMAYIRMPPSLDMPTQRTKNVSCVNYANHVDVN